MDNDRWPAFIGGLVLGIMITLGVVGTFGWTKYLQMQAMAEEARAQAEAARREAEMVEREMEMLLRQRAEQALQKHAATKASENTEAK